MTNLTCPNLTIQTNKSQISDIRMNDLLTNDVASIILILIFIISFTFLITNKEYSRLLLIKIVLGAIK